MSRFILRGLRDHLRNHIHTRKLYTKQAPFSGPPTYATVAQRLSSYPNPMAFFAEKRAKEAVDRGEFIDIHDIGPVTPDDLDVLITDMDDNNLRSDVAELIGIPYLQKATAYDSNKVVDVGHGIIYGSKFHPILPCVVNFAGNAHWVFFIYNTSSPLTFLSPQTAKVLHIERQPQIIKIAGYNHSVFLSETSNFRDLNILGSDFGLSNDVAIAYNGREKLVDFYFGWNTKWEVKPKL